MNKIPLFFLIVINTAIVMGMYAYLNRLKRSRPATADIIIHLGVLALSWLTFSVAWGLIITFDALESTSSTFALKAFADGFAVAMRVMMTGLMIICIPLAIYLRFNSSPRNITS